MTVVFDANYGKRKVIRMFGKCKDIRRVQRNHKGEWCWVRMVPDGPKHVVASDAVWHGPFRTRALAASDASVAFKEGRW